MIERKVIEIAQLRPEQTPAVQEMIREYLEWAFSMEAGSENAPTFRGVDDELRDLPGIFAPPKGRLLVAAVDGTISGCVALKPREDGTCELKRLYVRPAARGHNLGFLLVSRAIEEARSSGYQKIILDSHHTMKAAHAIYRKVGFVDVAAPDSFPKEMKPYVVFMEMDLR